jgi:hypothetical protein
MELIFCVQFANLRRIVFELAHRRLTTDIFVEIKIVIENNTDIFDGICAHKVSVIQA